MNVRKLSNYDLLSRKRDLELELEDTYLELNSHEQDQPEGFSFYSIEDAHRDWEDVQRSLKERLREVENWLNDCSREIHRRDKLFKTRSTVIAQTAEESQNVVILEDRWSGNQKIAHKRSAL